MTSPKRLMLLAAVTTAALGGLGHAQTDWKAQLGDYKGKTIRILMIQDPWVDAFGEIDKEFETLTGAKVTVDAFGYDQTHAKEVLVGTSKSSDYDVVVLDSPWVGEFAEGGFVENLNAYITKDAKIVNFKDFVPSFQTVSNWKGETVGMPFGAYFVMMHYRKDLLAKAGIAVPKNIEEFQAASAKLTTGGMFGTAFNNQRGGAVGQAYFEFIYNFGGKPFKSMYPGSKAPYSDMTPLLNSPQSIAVVKFFKDMLKNQPPGAENIAWDERSTNFATGKVAMINSWSVTTPGFTDPTKSNITDKFATTLYLAKKGVKAVPPLGGWVMGINKYSTQKQAAWDYIKWFTSAETHKKFVLAGGPPSRLSTLADPEVKAKQPWVGVLSASQKLSYAECRPRIPESFQVIDTIGTYIFKALSGDLTVEDAMNQANAEVGKLLKSKGYKVSL